MRLSPSEVDAIRSCARRAFGPDAVVRLFGSRVRDDLRGGDIDLHVDVGPEGRADLRAEIEFLVGLKEEIGDQRIDVVVRAPIKTERPAAPTPGIAGLRGRLRRFW